MPTSDRRSWPIVVGVCAIILLAAVLRLNGIDFGLPALNDPDELMFELGATRMITTGTLNPDWFGHPATTTMYVLALVNSATFGVGWLLGDYANPAAFLEAIFSDPGIVILPGRIAMAAFGVLCVWQTYRLGRQFGGNQTGAMAGLFAALLLACSPVHVTYSQIIRSDMMGTVFMLLCIGSALRIVDHGHRKDYIWAALWLALAVASKWPFAITSLAVLGAGVYRQLRSGVDRLSEFWALVGFGMLAPLLLILVSPYLVIDYETALKNMSAEARPVHLGSTGGSPLENAWWYLTGPLRDGLGTAGLVLAVGGIGLLARDRRFAWVVIPVMVAYSVMICAHSLRWERWAVPMLPLLAIAAGFALAKLIEVLRARSEAPALRWLAVAAFCVLPLTLAGSAWAEAVVRTNDTRQQASAWADQNIPAGSTVLIEHFAFDLFDQPWTVLFPLGEAGCVNARDMLAGRIDYDVVEAARSGRSNVDYGTLPEAARASCKADFAILAQMDRYRVEQDVFPEEHAAYEDLLKEMSVAASFTPKRGESSGRPVLVLKRR